MVIMIFFANANTSYPLAASSFTTAAPTNPLAPETSAFFIDFLPNIHEFPYPFQRVYLPYSATFLSNPPSFYSLVNMPAWFPPKNGFNLGTIQLKKISFMKCMRFCLIIPSKVLSPGRTE